jgi:hypothetical protein
MRIESRHIDAEQGQTAGRLWYSAEFGTPFGRTETYLFTAGVGSTGEIFASVFVDFQIVGDAFAVRAITKNQSIRWMI